MPYTGTTVPLSIHKLKLQRRNNYNKLQAVDFVTTSSVFCAVHCSKEVPYIHTYYIYIQSDSGGICNTLGNDIMCDSKQKSSYQHGSDFGRLQSYGYLLIPLQALV